MVHPVKIKPVQSAVQDKAPTTSEVAQGELAVNVHASSLAIYTLDASGAVAVLADGNRQADIATTNAATAQATADLAVTAVTGTAPIVSTGGLTPALSITAATTSAAGTMSSADKVILDAVSTTYVALAGSTMTGALTLSGDPTLAMNASTKQYTDANDFWTRTGTILSPETAGDGVSFTGDLTINTDALFVDASAKKVGIGETSPSADLVVLQNGSTFTTEATTVALFQRSEFTGSTSRISIVSGNAAASHINFGDIDDEDVGNIVYDHTSNYLEFSTNTSPAMQIDSSGSLLIGGTLPSSPNITLTGSTGGATFAGTITGEGVKSNTWMGADYVNMAGGNAAGGLFYGYSDAAGTTEVVRIDNDGSATFSGGVLTGAYDAANSATSGLSLQDSGRVIARRQTGSDVVWLGLHGGATGSEITAAGAATFAGDLFAISNTGDTRIGVDSIVIDNVTTRSKVSIDPGGWLTNLSAVMPPAVSIYAPSNADDSKVVWAVYDDATTGTSSTITVGGDATFAGTITGTSKNFRIPHPLPAKNDAYYLVHSSLEGPQADLIYSGMVTLIDGKAEINLDTTARMTEGTFLLLNTNLRRFVSNEGGWTAVKSSITGNVLTVEAQDDTCTDEVFWTVIGERKDQSMLDSGSTDENGRVITEPLKPVEVEPAA